MKRFLQKSIFVFLSLILVLTILPFSAFAAEDGLAKEIGTETPEIYCTYKTYKNGVIGNEVNGNSLSAGYYAVTFNIRGMSTFARINLGVTVNNDFAALGTWKDSAFTADSGNPISDLTTDYQSVNPVESINHSEIFVSLASSEENYTVIDSEGTAVVTIGMQVLQSCDAESIFDVNTNPNVTFAQPYYSLSGVALGDYDCYSLLVDASGYDGNLYGMSVDVSPKVEINGYAVYGTVYVMTNPSGVKGAAASNVTVSVDGRNVKTGVNGEFFIENVPIGVFSVTVSGNTSIDKTFSINITNSNYDIGNIAICMCDYNKDDIVDTLDLATFAAQFGKSTPVDDKLRYTDFNGDGVVDTIDLGMFTSFYGYQY